MIALEVAQRWVAAKHFRDNVGQFFLACVDALLGLVCIGGLAVRIRSAEKRGRRVGRCVNDTIRVVDKRSIHVQLYLVFIAVWFEVVPVLTDLLRRCCISVGADKDWPWDAGEHELSSRQLLKHENARENHSHAALRSSSSMKPPGEAASLLSSK